MHRINFLLNFRSLSFFLCCYLLLSCSTSPQDITKKSEENSTLKFSFRQLQNTISELESDATKFPYLTDPVSGKWIVRDKTSWTSGFFPGSLWLAYEASGNKYWVDQAEKWTWSLESMKNYDKDHDIGFRIMESFGNAYRLTGREAYRDVILSAAQTLTSRYDPTIGCIKSWDHTGNFPVIIDNMMNLELLFRASELHDNEEWFKIAREHAITTINNHIRADGSTYHVVDFNNDGSVKWKGTAQGYGDESTWSRGQAWGIYGFTKTYYYTKEKIFLTTAEKLALYFIKNLPEDNIPFYDFEDPAIPDVNKDASAAAIAASAFLDLYNYTFKEIYFETAKKMLNTLSSSPYLTEGSAISSILRKATQHKGDPERGAIYADYYFLEALLKLN